MITRIETELKDAMRARDEPRVATLRLTLSALRSAEKELLRPLKEDEELQVLQRERKRRLEAAKAFRDAGLEDYRVVVNVGQGGGQTIFHLHWHVLGGKIRGMPA